MITRTGSHALRALAVLASLPDGSYAGAVEIARQVKAPANYLGKLLHQLSRTGVVEGRKGSNGGFRLRRVPRATSLFDVLDPIVHVTRVNGCILGRPRCNSQCPVHEGWARTRETYLAFLKSTTLSDLMGDRPNPGRRRGGPDAHAAMTATGGVR